MEYSGIDLLIIPEPVEIGVPQNPECTCKGGVEGFCQKDEQHQWVVQEVGEYVERSFYQNIDAVERAFGNSFFNTFGRAMDPCPQGNGANFTVGLNIAMRVSVEPDIGPTAGASNGKSSMPSDDMPFGPIDLNSFGSIDLVKCSPSNDSDDNGDGESQGATRGGEVKSEL